MQHPTLENVRIRSTRDALHVFNGVARERLPLVTRRLDVDERRAIVAGNVYVWEERGATSENTGVGMERWTDGMGWGPSRVRDGFLFYHQKDYEEDPQSSTPWNTLLRKRLPSTIPDPERLVKQTYSVHVSLPRDRSRRIVRKWHLTAYFSQDKLESLRTVDSIRGVGDVPVPDGIFRNARTSKTRGDHHRTAEGIGASHPPLHTLPGSPNRTLQQLPHLPSSNLHVSTACSPVHSWSTPSSASTPSPGTPSSLSGRSQGLVPLEYLQNVAGPSRDPWDEYLLRRFRNGTNLSPQHKNQ